MPARGWRCAPRPGRRRAPLDVEGIAAQEPVVQVVEAGDPGVETSPWASTSITLLDRAARARAAPPFGHDDREQARFDASTRCRHTTGQLHLPRQCADPRDEPTLPSPRARALPPARPPPNLVRRPSWHPHGVSRLPNRNECTQATGSPQTSRCPTPPPIALMHLTKATPGAALHEWPRPGAVAQPEANRR